MSKDEMMIRGLFLFFMIILVPASLSAGVQLDFDHVVQTALKHAYDIKLSELDIRISRTALEQAKSLNYPEITARFISQYAKNLAEGNKQVTAIGTTYLLQNTVYQSYFSMNASINLYDFGAREKKIWIAAKDIEEKQAFFTQSVRDTKLKILEIYGELLLISLELNSKKELLSLYKDLSLIKERLFAAGKILKIELVEEAIKVVKTLDDLDNLKLRFNNALQDLTFCTGLKYDPDSLEVAGFQDQELEYPGNFEIQKSPEFKIYEIEIGKKKAELESIKREGYLPQFSFYSTYIFYGEDKDRYWGSLGEMQSRNYYIGLQANLPLFDGFKSSAQIEKTKIEIERLKVEKEKKLAELMNRYVKLKETKKNFEAGVKNQEEITAKVNDNLSMARRLAEQNISEYTDFLNQKIELVLQKYELAKIGAMKKAATMELRILSEGHN